MDLGYNGIFVSNKAIEELNIPVDMDIVKKAKDHMDQRLSQDAEKTCYILNKNYKVSEGIYLDPDQLADAIEKVMETKEKLWNEVKNDNMLRCDCGTKLKFKTNFVKCPKCEKEINVNKYKRKIKFPASLSLTFKLYIKSLRKKAAKIKKARSE